MRRMGARLMEIQMDRFIHEAVWIYLVIFSLFFPINIVQFLYHCDVVI